MTRVSTGQFRRTIEEYFEDRDMEITCRKRRRGYSLYSVDDDTPLARLRPTGEEDIVEIDWWDGNHWQSVTEFGLALPLIEALEYVTEDPDDIFFEAAEDDYEEDASDEGASEPILFNWAMRTALQLTVKSTVGCSMLGAACGGMVAGAPWGLLYGAGAAFVFCLLYSVITHGFRGVTFYLLFSGSPAMVLAGSGGAVGAAVCQTLGGGLWPGIGGAAAAVACAFLITVGTWPAWLIGFVVGLNLGISLTDSLDIRQHFLGAAVIALLAACAASLCRKSGNAVNAALHDLRKPGAGDTKVELVWGRKAPRS